MAQSALSVFCATPGSAPDLKNVGLNVENLLGGQGKANLLLRRYSETGSRSESRIRGFSGSTIWLNEADPVLTISLEGWMITRGGLANCGPGTKIDASMIANWRNRAQGREEENHFGWDVMGGWDFIVRNPSVTRLPGSLSDVSLQLVLECSAGKGGTASGGGNPPVSNPPIVIPEPGGGIRIVTVYTDQGSYQVLTSKPNPTLDDFFGSAIGVWDDGPPAKRPISGMPVSNPGADVQLPPINVLGVNVQADSGAGSGEGGEWLAGSSAEVTAGGFVPVEYGTSLWFFVLPNDGNLGRENIFMVSGHDFQPDALASIGKTEADFVSIYYEVPSTTGGRTNGWTKGKIDGVNLGSFFTRPGEA